MWKFNKSFDFVNKNFNLSFNLHKKIYKFTKNLLTFEVDPCNFLKDMSHIDDY